METQDTNNTMPTGDATQGGGLGPIIGILIIVALIAFGGLYFWGSQMRNNMGDEEMMGDNGIIDVTIEEPGTITEEEFNAILNEQSAGANATGQADPTLDAALDDLNDLDTLDSELDSLGSQL